MRWFVFFLMVMNGLVFVWFQFQGDQQGQRLSQQEAFDFSQVPGIRLVSEWPGARKLSNNKARIEQEKERLAREAEKRCAVVGPFEDMVTTRQMRLRMGYEEAEMKMIPRQLPLVHWVHVKPQATRLKALQTLKLLQKEGFDSFVTSDAGRPNAVSLGFFSNQDSAEGVAEQARAKGFDVTVEPRQREKVEYYVALNEQEAASLNDAKIELVQKEIADVKNLEKSCKTLASFKTFQ